MKKIKTKKKTKPTGQENTPNWLAPIKTKINEWKKNHKQRQTDRQEMKELAGYIAADMKVKADRVALLELAKRAEERAKQLRKLAEELA